MSSPWNFVKESNRIEGITREPLSSEVEEHCRFMALDAITTKDLKHFVWVYEPGATLRDQPGLDVQVGNYFPPRGDISIKTRLEDILKDASINVSKPIGDHAFEVHLRYENLHPFTDCNGRSGRMLWMWMMKTAPLGFLHTFYYQTLSGVANVNRR